MASLQPLARRTAGVKKPWRARGRFENIEVFLGCYETKEEAERREADFREEKKTWT